MWDLVRSLPWISMAPVLAWSVFFLGAFIYYELCNDRGGHSGQVFFQFGACIDF